MVPRLPHLETFAEAAAVGIFAAAARRLGITQATVSQRVQQLEARLNAPLFRREAGGVALTDAGRRLHAYARRILDLAAEAWAAVTREPTVVTGDLLLAASSVPGQYLLPPALAAFRRTHPGVRVRLSVSDTLRVLAEVEGGHVHLGVVGGRDGGGDNLEFRRFAGDELVIVVPPDHPWAGRDRVTPAELAAQPLVHREPGSATRACLERALAGCAAGPTVAAELGSGEAVKAAVVAGMGVAVLSRHAVLAEVAAGRLMALRVEGLPLTRDFYVVRDRRAVLPPPASLFLSHVGPEPCATRAEP